MRGSVNQGGGDPTQGRPGHINFELLTRRAGGGASPSEGRGRPPNHRNRLGSGESSRKVDAQALAGGQGGGDCPETALERVINSLGMPPPPYLCAGSIDSR